MTFTYTVTAADWGRIAPELVLAIMALVVMMADVLLPQRGKSAKESAPTNFVVLPVLSLVGLAGAFVATFVLFAAGDHQAAFNQMVSSDYGSLYAYVIILSASFLGFLLYGIAFTYAATGSTTFVGIRSFLARTLPVASPLNQPGLHSPKLLLIAMGLLSVGFAFKVSAIPFQAWVPDVYDGAPAPVTAFMSVATKAAALVAFARVFDVVFQPARGDWTAIIWAIAILTIVGGNIMALVQSSVKRMLAYSSIAHAGYLLIGVVVGGTVGVSAILFYLLCYTFMNLGAFGIVSMLERVDNSGSNYSEIRGLWYRQPGLAGLLSLFMLALAGFPPMAGFAAKYYLFYAALQGGHPELLIISVLASVLGMYYYLRVIAAMFMEREPVTEVAAAPATPAPVPDRRVSARLGNARDAATTVAVRASTSPLNREKVVAKVEEPLVVVGWTTRVALGIATLGTLAMGTVLAYWLVELAQYAVGIMLKVI